MPGKKVTQIISIFVILLFSLQSVAATTMRLAVIPVVTTHSSQQINPSVSSPVHTLQCHQAKSENNRPQLSAMHSNCAKKSCTHKCVQGGASCSCASMCMSSALPESISFCSKPVSPDSVENYSESKPARFLTKIYYPPKRIFNLGTSTV